MRALAQELARWAEGRELTVVFDGRPFELEADPVNVIFASRRGPNAADDDIVRIVEADEDPGGLHIVTSDHELARRVGELGAEVVSAGSFRALFGA
jgi:uncharacterized protein YaiI (UPF0178 family)